MPKNIQQLLKNVEGQVRGINNMIVNNQDCAEVLIQFKAAKSAFNSAINEYVQHNLQECVVEVDVKTKAKLSLIIKNLVNN